MSWEYSLVITIYKHLLWGPGVQHQHPMCMTMLLYHGSCGQYCHTEWQQQPKPNVLIKLKVLFLKEMDTLKILTSPFVLCCPCRYLYTGCVSLTTDNVLPILLLADKYNISSLSQTCIEYMLHHVVESPDTNRTLSWYQYGKMTANALLVDKCRKFILSNFDIILKTSDWMNLSKTEVIEFLSSNDLVVSDEFYLWQKVEKWLSSRYEDDEFSEVRIVYASFG